MSGPGVLPAAGGHTTRDRREAPGSSICRADCAAARVHWGGRALPAAVRAHEGSSEPEGEEEPERFFVFLPNLIRYAVKADTDAVLEAFGKNDQTRKVFRALFVALAGLVLAEVADPAAAQAILAALTGI